MHRFVRIAATGIAASVWLGVAAPALVQAQSFPDRPIRFIVPNPPGGGNDLLARELGQEMQKRLGQPVLVENRPGAGGNIGADAVAKAPPDGYTILMAANTFVINPSLMKSLPFDVNKDFVPVTLAGMITFALVVNPELPADDVKGLIAHLKANPGKVNYATPGAGTPHHLATELFMSMTGTQMIMVPFKGAGQMVPELLAGRVQVIFGAINSLIPHMKAGKLRGLAVLSAERASIVPELPTVAEAGVPGFAVDSWYGVLAPAGVPRDVMTKLAGTLQAIAKSPEFRAKMSPHGIDMVGSTPEEFGAVMKQDQARWAKVVKDAGIRPE
jgi:tripartite-type tricarboxylate transporter receptor subunit TctC